MLKMTTDTWFLPAATASGAAAHLATAPEAALGTTKWLL